jgi:hypothetical protein
MITMRLIPRVPQPRLNESMHGYLTRLSLENEYGSLKIFLKEHSLLREADKQSPLCVRGAQL